MVSSLICFSFPPGPRTLFSHLYGRSKAQFYSESTFLAEMDVLCARVSSSFHLPEYSPPSTSDGSLNSLRRYLSFFSDVPTRNSLLTGVMEFLATSPFPQSNSLPSVFLNSVLFSFKFQKHAGRPCLIPDLPSRLREPLESTFHSFFQTPSFFITYFFPRF